MTAVVVDTMVASAWLDQRPSARKERWQPVLAPAGWILPDRWVAAVALAANRPLATEDSIFDGVPQLMRAQPVEPGDQRA
jgi:hypothetical protein